MTIRPLHDHILVIGMQFDGRYTASGVYLPSDNGKSSGIRPRWGKVYAVGPDQKDIKVGQYVLVAHGRWTRGLHMHNGEEILTIHGIDNNDILLVSDTPQFDETMSTAI